MVLDQRIGGEIVVKYWPRQNTIRTGLTRWYGQIVFRCPMTGLTDLMATLAILRNTAAYFDRHEVETYIFNDQGMVAQRLLCGRPAQWRRGAAFAYSPNAIQYLIKLPHHQSCGRIES